MFQTFNARTVAAAMAAALALGLAAPAEAKCPPGQAKKGNCIGAQVERKASKGNNRARDVKRQQARAPARAAEPGRAVVPLAVTGATVAGAPVLIERLHQDDDITIGDSLGISRYQRVVDPLLFGLPVRSDDLAYYRVGDRIVVADPRDYRVREFVEDVEPNRFCPPGLAKKEPACIPPGQVDKIMRTEWDEDRFLPITDYSRYGLDRPGDNWGYYVVDNSIVRVDNRTHEILSIVRLIDAIL